MIPRGYVPIRDYAAIGDGRTVALVARDGSIDWLCLPNLDSRGVFGAILDPERGGRFSLEPDGSYEVERRYRPGTNVLETTFRTGDGVVRVTDAMTVPGAELGPYREVARRIEGLAGRVRMRWRVAPRFGYGLARTRIATRGAIPIATSGAPAVAVCAWDAGDVTRDAGGMGGTFEAREGHRALLALVTADSEPLVFPRREDVEVRLDATVRFWESWARRLRYAGPWRAEVERSALLLKLLVFAPSGAIAAAPTTSLPEAIGGERNWDYRFCWIRDSSFTLEALLQLGCHAEARSFFWWFMHATQLTHPRLHVFYRLDGGTHASERTLPLAGYHGSRPVRVGNAAASQLQLDTYGHLLDTAYVYATRADRLDTATGKALADVADFVCGLWREPDHGIWEVRMARQHFTESKVMCWVALDRAIRLAQRGDLPTRHIERWRREADAIRAFVETHCWSERRRAYVRYAGTEQLDASVLLMAIMRYHDPRDPRIASTIDAIRAGLGHGPLVYRYTGEDGIIGGEGVFLCCSFWLIEALAVAGRHDEATELMEKMLALANDVGLYSEEIDPASHEFLGNFPQGLVHLALVSAARAVGTSP
jgi:GH15 family glucan-1,4-alpha-glucosidase